MTTPTPDALCGRLRAMEGDFYTRLWTHRAADLIQQQQATIERLSAALEPFARKGGCIITYEEALAARAALGKDASDV